VTDPLAPPDSGHSLLVLFYYKRYVAP